MIPSILEIPLPFGFGVLPIHSFGLMMVLTFLSAWKRLWLNLSSAGEDPALAEQMITWAAVGGIVGARIGYALSYPREFIEDPIGMLIGGAGFVFYGGLIGGAFAVWLLLRRRGRPFLYMADLTGAALALGYAVGRVGCQLSGDGDYGRESNLPWAMDYSLGVVPTVPGVLHHPAPIYESCMALLITAVLLMPSVQSRLPRVGQLFGLYLLLSAIARFCVEIVRIEPRVAGALSQAQVVSIMLALIALVLLLRPAPNRNTYARQALT